MSWVAVVNDNFNRANTSPGGAGTTTGAGNGWIDLAGGVYYINSNALQATTAAVNGYRTEGLLRPSGENAIDQRITQTFTADTATNAAQPYIALRIQSGSTPDRYLANVDPVTGDIYISKIVSGTISTLAGPGSTTFTAGHVYEQDFSAVDIGGTTTLTYTITDITTSTVTGTLTVNDSSASLQGSGAFGLFVWGARGLPAFGTYNNVTTYVQSGVAAISASPSTIVGGSAAVAGSTGNVLTITGTNTAFSGSPFAITGGAGPLLTAQSVVSGTSATVTLSAGLYGYGALTLTDTGSGATTSITVSKPALGALKMGFIGDSITAGTNGNPVAQMASVMTDAGYTVSTTNAAVSASGTGNWLPGGAYMNAAVSAFAGASVTEVHIMLGTNDNIPAAGPLTPAQSAANMAQIVPYLVGLGYKVTLAKPVFTIPNVTAGARQGPNEPNFFYGQMWALNLALADGVNVFGGDSGAYQMFANDTSLISADGVHASASGNLVLGTMWAEAYFVRYGVPSGGGSTTRTAFQNGFPLGL
ncbi:MAG: SGNH/GDSL hydrolase family protein [Bacteroidia bacterium]